MGQSPKNKDGPKPKKHVLANAEKTIKPKGAALRAAPLGIIIFCIGQGMFFLDLAHPYFLGFGPCLFFGLWPMLIFWALAPAYFWALAPAYFLGFGPRLFYPLLFLAVAGASPGNY